MSSSTAPIEALSIYEAATKCRDSFLPCLTIAGLMELEWAENRLADFNLWANGIGAFAGHRASLDERLSRDPDTRSIIIHVLELLQSCVQQCQSLEKSSAKDSLAQLSHGHDSGNLSPPDVLTRSFSPFSDESSDSEPRLRSDGDSNGSTALTAMMRDVEQLINQLARLSIAIRNAGTASRFRKADKLFNPDDYGDLQAYLENIAKARPLGPIGTGVDILKNDITHPQKRLIEANLRRRNRFVYAMRHAQKLAMEPPKLPDKISLAPGRLNTEYAEPVPIRPSNVETLSAGSIAPDFTETNASSLGTLPPLLPVIGPPSRATMTQITSTAAKVVYPKPPKVKAGLQQFKCPCCCQTLPLLYQESTQWKKHLMDDIRPYTCTLDDCPSPETLYMLRSDWTKHIENDHRKSWQCLHCSIPGAVPRLFTTVEMLTQHIRGSHSEVVLEEHIATVVSASLRPAPFGVSRCPLCDTTGTSDSDLLFDHIAEHIHAFALQSLPWPDDFRESNYFSQNEYFDDESINLSQHYNVSNMSDRDSDGLPPIADISYDDDRDGPVSLPHIFDITEGIDETESIEETNSNEEAYDSETYEDSADNEESEDDEETLPTRPPMQMWDDFPTTLGNPPPYTGPLINRPLGPKHRFFDRNLPELMIPKLDEIYDSVEYDYYEESEGYKEPERSSVDAPINWAERKVERILSLLAIYEADDPELNEINEELDGISRIRPIISGLLYAYSSRLAIYTELLKKCDHVIQAYEHREQLQAIENLPLDDLIEAPLSPHSEASEFGDATQIDDF